MYEKYVYTNVYNNKIHPINILPVVVKKKKKEYHLTYNISLKI